MNYRKFQLLTILVPTLLIGGFEYIRHIFLRPYLSMAAGNFYITLLTLFLSFLFSIWIFRKIRYMNEQLIVEQARRAVYEERERIAKELHDGIAQSLFFLNVKLKQGAVDEAYKSISEIDKNLRQAIFNLRSLPEDSGSFSERIAKWIWQWSTFTGIDVNQKIKLPDHLFTTQKEVQLFAIIQEAFTNIQKHANASEVDIHLMIDSNGRWRLSICDNGVGIQKLGEYSQQYGVSMIKERASQLGATFEFRNRETVGTELLIISKNERKHV